MILLDYRDKRPIYEQVVEKLERLIVSGGLEPLTKMPSVRGLAMELSVNPNTIQRAYAQLEQDGYLYTVSGRGSFVTAENEWRENRQSQILREWGSLTLQAKETGIAEESLASELRRIYENADSETGRSGAADAASNERNGVEGADAASNAWNGVEGADAASNAWNGVERADAASNEGNGVEGVDAASNERNGVEETDAVPKRRDSVGRMDALCAAGEKADGQERREGGE